MKKVFLIACFVLLGAQADFANAASIKFPEIIKNNPGLNTIVTLVVLGRDINENTPGLGEGICRAGGGSNCSGVSLAEGICRAGGGSNCSGI